MGNLSLEIKWGIIFILIGFIWKYFEMTMGWHGEHFDRLETYALFYIPIPILIYVLAIREKKSSLGGIISWKEGFITGLKISLFIALLSPLSQYVINSIISPGYFPNAIRYTVDNGFLTQSQAEAYFNLKSQIQQAFISSISAGTFTSAIVAFVLKSRS